MSKFYSVQTGGFYAEEIHGENIPEDSVEITDEHHQLLLVGRANGKQIKLNLNGKPILIDPDFDFGRAFAAKNAEIRSAFHVAMQPITGTYTAEDIASFPTQEAEAKAWQADNNVDTPLLDYMVANRPSVDKATLVSRILANSVIYKQVAGPVIGKKQHFEDLLYALKAQQEDPEQPDVTQPDFDAIVVDFS